MLKSILSNDKRASGIHDHLIKKYKKVFQRVNLPNLQTRITELNTISETSPMKNSYFISVYICLFVGWLSAIVCFVFEKLFHHYCSRTVIRNNRSKKNEGMYVIYLRSCNDVPITLMSNHNISQRNKRFRLKTNSITPI